ncbi:MAG: 50S ribosomal protein L22 [Parcubacteria group bacterium RIFOXYD2_FULL_52_8]|nr:ribosomal protein L22 [uncultured bacterium]OHB25025.1 MAG: 50S ribosomal protein L22 [Parcubacteria group bacterium RIFOXYD2_FULL_52_8]
MTEVTAHLRSYRQAPRKVRLVADLVRGKSVAAALVTLDTVVKRVSAPMKKLLMSAVANAEHNHKLERNTLFIKEITVDQGQILKRSMPRARGVPFPIHKHTSHISLVLGEKASKAANEAVSEQPATVKKPRAKAPVKAAK